MADQPPAAAPVVATPPPPPALAKSPLSPPEATPPAVPPAAPAGTLANPKTPPPLASDDPFMAKVMADMGFTVKEGKLEKAPESVPAPPKESTTHDFTTLGEHARFKAERAAKPTAPDPAAATPPPATTEPPAKPETPVEPAKPKPKIEVEKGKPIEEIVEGVMKRLQKPADSTPAPPAAPAPKTEDPDAAYVESLDEVQREEIELARYAAKAMPEQYGKLAERTVTYFKKVDEFIAAKQKEDPNWDPDEDESFASFVEENRPIYKPGDRRKLERSMIAAEVRADVEKEIKPQLEESARVTKVQEIKPEIEKAIPSYQQQVAQTMAADEKSPLKAVMAKALEGGMTEESWNAAKEVDPLAATIAKSFTQDAVNFGKLYLELATGVRPQVGYKPELSPNSKHNQEALQQAKLFDFIDNQEAIFHQNGGNLRVVDGKSFLPRREYAALPKAEQAKHWTIGHKDVLNLLSDNAAIGAKEALEMELKRRESEGYTRNGKKEVTKSETAAAPKTPAPAESPKATVTPSPGAGTPPPPATAPSLMPEDQLKKLFAPGVRQWA